ncbi:MAG TPA: CocE/NonD family hydrolase [Acidimicrobiales bacterium]
MHRFLGRRTFHLAVSAAALAAVLVPTGLAGLSRAAAAPEWFPQPAIYGSGSQLDVGVTMADGTVLRADVYYPTVGSTKAPAAGPFPVLLQQTPYGKAFIAYASALANTDIDYLVDRGFIVVLADVRGTGDSGGTFDLFDPVQSTDGATLSRWAAALPHSDGKVGLFGESYMGINQFQTVGAAGPNSPIGAIFPVISGNDLFADTVTQGGIPDVEFSAAYIALLGGLNLTNPALQPLVEAAQSADPTLLAAALLRLTPVEAEHSSTLVSFLHLLLDVETGQGPASFDDAYWAARSPAHDLATVVADHIPAFLVGGWNDLFQAGEPLNYAGLQNLYDGRPQTAPMTATQAVTPRYQLMMGPWEHVTTGDGINLSAIEVEWFDTWLLGQDTPLAHSTTPVHLMELNSRQWDDTARWPLPAAPATPFYFGPGRSGSGALSDNDGTLSTVAPAAGRGADLIAFAGVSSPCDVQTDQWAAGLLALGLSTVGKVDPCDTDDNTLGTGPGALTYTTAPFTQPEIIGGPIDATVYLTSTTKNTELAATVEAVAPNGGSLPLTSGALLGTFRALDPSRTWVGGDGLPILPVHPLTAASQLPVVPGAVTREDIEIFPTFADIPGGWRLRVTITTAETPHLLVPQDQLSHLVGGLYDVQRHAGAASLLNVPLAPAAAYNAPCGNLCSATGP